MSISKDATLRVVASVVVLSLVITVGVGIAQGDIVYHWGEDKTTFAFAPYEGDADVTYYIDGEPVEGKVTFTKDVQFTITVVATSMKNISGITLNGVGHSLETTTATEQSDERVHTLSVSCDVDMTMDFNTRYSCDITYFNEPGQYEIAMNVQATHCKTITVNDGTPVTYGPYDPESSNSFTFTTNGNNVIVTVVSDSNISWNGDINGFAFSGSGAGTVDIVLDCSIATVAGCTGSLNIQ